MKRKILFSIIIFLTAVAGGSFFVLKSNAASTDTASGWLWGGSEDCDMDGNGFKDSANGCGGDNVSTPIGDIGDGSINGNETGLGWSSMNSTDCDLDGNTFVDVICGGDNVSTAVVNYGVNIPSGDGAVTGYAWSENIGWIDFGNNCGTDYIASCSPPSGSAGVSRVGNDLTGWARIVGIAQESALGNSGGWEGWIKMDNGSNKVTVSSGTFVGYAWSDELGWISFDDAKFGCVSDGVFTYSVIPAVCHGGIACGGTAYWQCNQQDNCGNRIVDRSIIAKCVALSGNDIICNAQCSTSWIETNPN